MIYDDPRHINFVSKKIQNEILEMKPELSKFVEEGYFEDCDEISDLLE